MVPESPWFISLLSLRPIPCHLSPLTAPALVKDLNMVHVHY